MLEKNDTSPAGESPSIPATLREVLGCGSEVKLHLLHHYAELARMLARELLDEEVTALCGDRYSRDKPFKGRFSRWGSNPGSIQVQEERVPIEVPRVRDTEADQEQPLKVYQDMKKAIELDGGMEEAIRRCNIAQVGLSQRDYGRVAGAFGSVKLT